MSICILLYLACNKYFDRLLSCIYSGIHKEERFGCNSVREKLYVHAFHPGKYVIKLKKCYSVFIIHGTNTTIPLIIIILFPDFITYGVYNEVARYIFYIYLSCR